MTDKIGATGEFPDGKLHTGDQGELRFAISADSRGNVHINFGKDVSWLAMPPEAAIQFARLLLLNAGVKKIQLDF